MTKMLLATLALWAFSFNAQATIPRAPAQVSNIVRVLELEQRKATEDQKAQTQANATGHPVYANGGVYLPAPKPLP